MKPELTPELKERFFAQYWGQKVLDGKSNPVTFPIWYPPSEAAKQGYYALLRPIVGITDKEALIISEIMKVEDRDFWTDQFSTFRVYNGNPLAKELDYEASRIRTGLAYAEYFFRENKWANRSVWYCEQKLILAVGDYLRSVGVSIPFMGHSVQELVNAGWVRLVES